MKTDGAGNERAPELWSLPPPALGLVLLLPPDGVLFELLGSSGSGTPLWKSRMI